MTLTLAGVEPIDFAISVAERPSSAILRIRSMLFGVKMRSGMVAWMQSPL
jgi:hypothetical protein